MERGSDLGTFLQSRRARLLPADVGLVAAGRRRVPGLRREELAQLAGVSVDYYIRLEQGRATGISEAILEAIAAALGLDEVERAHLHDLARPRRTTRRAPQRQQVRPAVRWLLDSLHDVPAFVAGGRMDVLAWNRLGGALFDFDAMAPGDRNMIRHAFLNPAARRLYVDWADAARPAVGYLRLYAGRRPDDPELAALVGELSVRSEQFRTWWAAHDVREKANGTKRLRHPVVGPLTLAYETMELPGDQDQALVTYTAEPGSESAAALGLLASWAGPAPAD